MSTLDSSDFDGLLATALEMADAAADVTLKHFRTTLNTGNKEEGTGFDPVTVADRGSEAAMRAVLARRRPDDGIFGEEEGRHDGTSGLTWVLDPIDGTRAYISGLPVWGTLIGMDDGQSGRLGVIDQPHIGERFVGILNGEKTTAWLDYRGDRRPIAVRPCASLVDATMFTTDPYLLAGVEAAPFAELRSTCRLTRYGTDCYAYALIASGQIDLVVESGLHAYDIASHVPLIRAAGGIVTDWQGGDCRWGGRVVAAGDPRVHAAALEILSKVP